MDRGTVLPKIKKDIDKRNSTDMKLYPSMVFSVLFLFTAVAVYRLFEKGSVPADGMFSVTMVGFGLMSAIVYALVTRAFRHNKRDAALMSDVADFFEIMVPDGAHDQYVEEIRDTIDTGIKQKTLFLMFFVIMMPAVIAILLYVVGYGDVADITAMRTLEVCFFLSLLLVLGNINYSKRHERRFLRFSAATVSAFEEMGIVFEGYKKSIGRRNVKLMTFLCIITLGLFFMIWVCIYMRDFNRHIDEQWSFENNLLEAVGLLDNMQSVSEAIPVAA